MAVEESGGTKPRESGNGAGADRTDWAEVLDGLERGETQALLTVSPLIVSTLVGLRAYDFQQEWADLTQECLEALVRAIRGGNLREPAKLPAYLRAIVRNKFNDRLKRHLGENEDAQLPWEEVQESELALSADRPGPDVVLDVRRALAAVPEPRRTALVDVYVRGLTYEEAAAEAALPLGTFKDALKQGLRTLRGAFLDKS